MKKSDVIGRVVATESSPTTSTSLKFWIDGAVVIRPFDVVRIDHLGRDKTTNTSTYAMVTDLDYLTDGAGFLSSYISSDFGDVHVPVRNERVGTTIATCDVLYNSGGIEMPVRDGQAVYWADADGVKESLGIKGFKEPIPAGYMSMSNGEEITVEFESDFLIGPEGAHLNIAGISGLATKTSYAMFLLNALQQKKGKDVSIVIFNVKGHDLLSIDQERPDLPESIKKGWAKCGLKPTPFKNVTYFYPYTDDPKRRYTQSRVPAPILDKQIKSSAAFNYYYDVEAGKERLSLLLADIDDPQSTMESCAYKTKTYNESNWKALLETLQINAEGKGNIDKEIMVQSWRKFYRLLRTRLDNGIFSEKNQTKQSERRQKSSLEILKYIRPGAVCVIDIEPLPDYIQCLIVGDIISLIMSAKLGEFDDTKTADLGRVVIFADELNKYAPKNDAGGRSLTSTLLEVTERGRSLGTVLFGAEQFRSGVHERVLGNCSTSAFGRTNPVEIGKGREYRIFSKPQISSLIRLPKGSLMVQHPLFTAQVIKVRFPEPVYVQPKG